MIVDELDGSDVLVHPRPLAALEDVLALVMFVVPVNLYVDIFSVSSLKERLPM